jgi:signal transduction histidine kinase
MGSLVAGVAHEVRNPLFTISASIDAFEARFGSSSEESRYLSVLRGGVNRLSSVMEQLLDYGKPTPYFPTRAEPGVLIQEAVDSLAAESGSRGVRIVTRVPEALPTILVDRGRLVQVFQNLILNALQHSKPESTVVLAAIPIHESGRSWIECTVED